MSINSLLNFFKLDDDEQMDEEEYYNEDYEEQYQESEPSVRKASRPAPADNYTDEAPRQRGFLGSKPKVVPMGNNRAMPGVNVTKPTTFEDSQEICNMLLTGRPVIVNLEGFDPNDAQRIMDFISGCIYAIKGKYHQISKYIFIFSPEHVDISGDSLSMDSGMAKMPMINREF